MISLWAIWTKLSIFVYFLIIVSPIAPLSIVVFAPISTSSSTITVPIWSILVLFPFTFTKPKPSEPITAPGWITQFLPISTNSLILTLE